MDLAEFDQLRKTCKIAVNKGANVLSEPVEQLPDSALKNEWLGYIEDVRKENHRRCNKLFDLGESNRS